MENWITRLVAAICAAGSTVLFWTFGMFIVVPWQEGRMLSLNMVEIQVIGIPLVIGLLVTWGALHIFAIADRETNPRIYATICIVIAGAAIAATIGGAAWSQARIA
jgi:hypothetical protein